MAKIIWTDSAITDVIQIAQYIALDKPIAAKKLVQQILDRVEQLAEFPESGKKPIEIEDLQYLEIIVSPCRIFYRFEKNKVYIMHAMRSERDLRQYLIGLNHQSSQA